MNSCAIDKNGCQQFFFSNFFTIWGKTSTVSRLTIRTGLILKSKGGGKIGKVEKVGKKVSAAGKEKMGGKSKVKRKNERDKKKK